MVLVIQFLPYCNSSFSSYAPLTTTEMLCDIAVLVKDTRSHSFFMMRKVIP